MTTKAPKRTLSAAFRGALWITLIALVTTSMALTVQYAQTMRLLEMRAHALVDDEAAELIARYRSQGLGGVASAIERAQQLPRINEFFYLLATPQGERMVGNLTAWPGEVNRPGYRSFVTEVVSTSGTAKERWVEARAIRLEGGFRLLVGNLSDERMAVRNRYVSALLWSLLTTGGLGMLFGFWYSRRGLAFVETASRTGERFLDGRLEERLPVSSRGDEYDRLAITINQCFEEVEQLVGSLRVATDGLAHDLKTPITRIRARLELARDARGEDLRHTLEDTREDLDAILQLINDILALARAEATVAASFTELRLDRIVAEAIELFQPLADEKQLILAVNLEPVTLNANRSLIAQAASNLLDNAIKYTPPRGTISVSVCRQGRQTLLSVGDSGPGIPAGRREQALARFSRLDESRSTPGSGIGLSVVSAAARVHRAELTLRDNEPGLRVELAFPLAALGRESAEN